MRVVSLVPALLAITACGPSVEQRLAAADRALDAGDSRTAALAFAEVADTSERWSDDWVRARLGAINAMANELPDRAVREVIEMATEHPSEVSLEDWIAVAGRLGSARAYDQASAVLDFASKRDSNYALRLDEVARRISAQRDLESRTGFFRERKPWDGASFHPSEVVAELCAFVPRGREAAYDRYLELAKLQALSADDCGALVLAYYNDKDFEHAQWVIWNASIEHANDVRIRSLTEFVYFGSHSDTVRALRAIECDF